MREFHPLFEFARHPMNECLDILGLPCGRRFLICAYVRLRIRIALADGKDLRALLPVDENAQHPLRHA